LASSSSSSCVTTFAMAIRRWRSPPIGEQWRRLRRRALVLVLLDLGLEGLPSGRDPPDQPKLGQREADRRRQPVRLGGCVTGTVGNSLVEQIQTGDRWLAAIARRQTVIAIDDPTRFRRSPMSERTLGWFHADISRAKSIVPDGSQRPGSADPHPAVDAVRAPPWESTAFRAEDLGRSPATPCGTRRPKSLCKKARRDAPSALARGHGLRPGLTQLARRLGRWRE
jgi:hypothetical protein